MHTQKWTLINYNEVSCYINDDKGNLVAYDLLPDNARLIAKAPEMMAFIEKIIKLGIVHIEYSVKDGEFNLQAEARALLKD